MLPTSALRFRVWIDFLVMVLLAFSPHLAHSQDKTRGKLQGKICDESGKPIASATVNLTVEGGTKSFNSRTGPDGMFSLPLLPLGNYRLEVAAAGFANAEFSSVSIGPEAKTFDVSLRPANASAVTSTAGAQFFDPPQFTVSGVTDTTNMGGHGSGPVVRNREAIEKDVISLSSRPSASPSVPESRAYEVALAEVTAGQYAKARSQLQNLVAQQPTAESHHLLATVDEKLGNSLEAVQEYQLAAELNPSESNIFDWGSELLLHHAAEPAIEVFAKGNRLFPKSARMLVGLGAAEFAAGSNDRAEQRLCQASDLHPEDSVPYIFLGKVQRTDPSISPELIDRFQRFVKLRPDDAKANYLYAVALWKQNQPAPADAIVAQIDLLLRTSLHLDPKFAEAYLQLGIVNAYRQNSGAAIQDYQRAIQNQPRLEEAHYRLAEAYRSAGKMDEARAEVAVYQRLSHESAERIEREHREIKQFVYSLRDKPKAQTE